MFNKKIASNIRVFILKYKENKYHFPNKISKRGYSTLQNIYFVENYNVIYFIYNPFDATFICWRGSLNKKDLL